MSEEDDSCKGTTADGSSCGNEAGDDGYCHLHEPPEAEPPVEPDDGDEPVADESATADADAAPADDGPDHAEPGDRYPKLRVRSPEGGHVAGYSFGTGEVKTLPATASVKDALRKGQLQRVL